MKHFEATLYDAGTTPKGDTWRLRVERDPDWGLAIVADEQMTSANRATAQVVLASTLQLTRTEAVWVHAQLGALLAEWPEDE